MIPQLLIVLSLAPQGASQPTARPCTADEIASQESHAQQIARGDIAAYRLLDGPRTTERLDDTCVGDKLIRSTLRGWRSARELVSDGGVGERLAPTMTIVDEELELLRHGNLALEAEYAQTAIKAAIAAAQDERPEMALLLAHARDLSERLVARNRRALWPRPFNLLAGELWLEVDRYEDARLAFERAVRADPSPLALVGLARALARLERRAEACAAYARLGDQAGQFRNEAREYLRKCR